LRYRKSKRRDLRAKIREELKCEMLKLKEAEAKFKMAQDDESSEEDKEDESDDEENNQAAKVRSDQEPKALEGLDEDAIVLVEDKQDTVNNASADCWEYFLTTLSCKGIIEIVPRL